MKSASWHSFTAPTAKCEVSPSGQNAFSQAFQVFLVLVGLFLLSPLFLLIALAIRLTSPGPIFYRGQRVGKDQQVFYIRKFRTLIVGAEQRIGARLLKEEDQLYTPIGKFLKKTKFDELPQLLNVLTGDMSLVGPRPVRPIFLEQLKHEVPNYEKRFQVRPGMTGLAQVRGGYWTAPRDKLRYELVYINNQSLLFDLKLIWLTLLKICNRWVTTGMLLWAFLLFVSFFPSSLYSWLYASIWGVKVNLLYLAIASAAAWVIGKRTVAHRLYIYHSSVYLPMAGFLAVGFISAGLSFDPETAARGAIYYLVTGFLLVLGPLNTKVSSKFVRSVATVVSLACGVLSFFGLMELALVKQIVIATTLQAGAEPIEIGAVKATFANANVLSAYLVLGFPVLLCQLIHAKTRDARDFWLVSATITLTSILLTQNLLGLVALFVACVVFLAYIASRTIPMLVCLFLVPLFLLGVWGQSTMFTKELKTLRTGASELVQTFTSVPSSTLLFGSGIKTHQPRLDLAEPPLGADVQKHTAANNMHRTLLLETGILGWFFLMWIISATLRTLFWGARHATDSYQRTLLWAIFASLLGFLISMSGLDAFFYLPLQVLFWSMAGLGIGIVTHQVNKRSPFYVVWRFGDDRPQETRQRSAREQRYPQSSPSTARI